MGLDLAGVKIVRRALYETEAEGCVTAAVDRIDFKKPAFLGDLIVMTSEIKSIGHSSFQVRIKVERESIKGHIEEICVVNFTFVAIKDKKPYQHNLSFEKLQ